MNAFDYVLIALWIAASLWGLKKGAVGTALLVGGLFLAMQLSARFASTIVGSVTDSVSNEAIATAIGYVAIFILVFIALGFVSKVIHVVLAVTMMGWLDRLLGIGLGVVAGVLLMTAATMITARYVYVFEESDDGSIQSRAEEFAKEKGRERLGELIVESELVDITLKIRDAVPGSFLGLVPGDFNTAMDELEKARDAVVPE